MLHRYISVFFAAGKDELLFAELAEDFDGDHQGETDDEASKDNEGLLVPAGKKPVKKLAESQDTCYGADQEHCQNNPASAPSDPHKAPALETKAVWLP